MAKPHANRPAGTGLNILLVNHYAVPPTQPGITRHYSLASELIRRGHHVTILASSFDHVTHRETRSYGRQPFQLEAIMGVPFLWLKTPAYRGNSLARLGNMAAFAARALAQAARAGLPAPDLVLGSSPDLFAALAAERLARRLGVPFVLEVRDLWPQTLLDLGRIPRWHPLVLTFAGIERHLYRRARRIITLLPGAAEHLIAKGASPEQIRWLPNGIDLHLVGPLEPPVEKPEFTVLYTGSHGLANGMDALLDTAKLLLAHPEGARIRFRLVGDGAEKARLMARAQSERISNLSFEPACAKERVYALLQEADAFIVTLKDSPLYRHGISLNKLYDYLAAGRPTVLGSGAMNNPVAEAGAGLTTPPEDAPALAEALLQLARMPLSQRREMGLRGRQHVEARYDFSKLGEQLESCLFEALQEDYAPNLPAPRRALGMAGGAGPQP